MQQLIIIGAGGFGREVFAWALQAEEFQQCWTIKGFLDDNPAALAGFALPVPVLAGVGAYQPAGDDVFVCAIGVVAAKRRCVEAVLQRGGQFTSVTHRTVVQGLRGRRGVGVILCPHVVVSSDVTLGDFVTLNYHSTIAHDAALGAFTQVHCHADITGGVQAGTAVLIGSHASILPGVRIGDGATVGAGSVVVRDVPPGVTVFGNPARILPTPGP